MLSLPSAAPKQSIYQALRKQNQRVTEEFGMVKLRFDKSKMRYMNDKKIYNYDRITLVFPTEYHDLLKPLRDKQLSIHVTRKDGSLNISLSEEQKP
jgi:hypothetical protein